MFTTFIKIHYANATVKVMRKTYNTESNMHDNIKRYLSIYPIDRIDSITLNGDNMLVCSTYRLGQNGELVNSAIWPCKVTYLFA